MFSETIKLVRKIYLFQAKADGKYSEKIKKNIYFMLSSLKFSFWKGSYFWLQKA